MLRNQKAQAILELAVLGSLIILAFSIAISYSEKGNREQSYMQQTFRSALKEAKRINNSASWQAMDFRRMPNVANPMELGELKQFSSSNKVLWSDGKIDAKTGKPTESKSWFQLNRGTLKEADLIEIPVISPQDVYVPNEKETISTEFETDAKADIKFDITKEEGGVIKTIRSLKASDTIKLTTNVGGKPKEFVIKLGEGGKYFLEGSPDGKGISRKSINAEEVQ